ncbi:hypothetical protein B484DRAFT_463745, partial [Ochromonadaceae sp. CCMP2298]
MTDASRDNGNVGILDEVRLINSSLRRVGQQVRMNVVQAESAAATLDQDGKTISKSLNEHKYELKGALSSTSRRLRQLQYSEQKEKIFLSLAVSVFLAVVVYIISKRMGILSSLWFIVQCKIIVHGHGHGHGHGYVPPTPPSEVIVAVAMSKDRSRAEAWKQQAAAASGRRRKNAPAQPAPLYLPGGQGAAAVSAEARTRGGAGTGAGAGVGGVTETQSLLLNDVSARDAPPRFSMMTPSGMAAAAPGDALSPVSESSGPPLSPAPLSRNSNGNGYSIGASLPRGVTWR